MDTGKLKNANIEGGKLIAQFSGLFIGKARQAMLFALRSVLAFLLKHIRNVLFLSASKEMVRANAVSNIAMMADQKIIGNKAMRQGIRESVCKNLLATVPELAVSIAQNGSSPQPAVARLIHFAPKDFTHFLMGGGCTPKHAMKVMVVDELVLLAVAYCRFATTSTLAIAVGDFVRGVVRDMLDHVVSPPKTCGHALGRLHRRQGTSIG
jgi:hypothetical protein